MNSCIYVLLDGHYCDSPCEGKTSYCASHGRQFRKEESDRLKAEQKRNSLMFKPQEPRKKPNKVSAKRRVLNAEYNELRPVFLKDHTVCELKLQGCTGQSTEVHHTASGWNKSTNLNNVATWKASCANCNQFLHDKISAREARELGLKV